MQVDSGQTALKKMRNFIFKDEKKSMENENAKQNQDP